MSKLLEQINTAPKTTRKLGEVFEIIDGDRGSNYPSKSEFTKNGYCVFLNTKNVPSQGFNFSDVDFVSKERDELLRKGKLERNDIVMTTRGTIGNVAYYSNDIPFDCVRINSGMVILRSRPENDRLYLYTLIKSTVFNTQLKNTSSGSAQPQLPIKDLKEIEFDLPDLPIQKKIAEVLGAYDAKIENNNKIIKNLETLAQTIFNEWFVNFRFPGYEKAKFVGSEMGEIPEGWEVGKLSNEAYIIMGQSPESHYYNENSEGMPFHQGVTYFGERFPKNVIYSTGGEKTAREGDVLVSVRAPVGRINLANSKTIIGRGLSAVRSKNEHQSYLLYLLKNLFHKEDLFGSGSVFPAINKKEFENLLILVPKIEIEELFEKTVAPIDKKIHLTLEENIVLKKTRDRLLVKLI